MYNTADHSHFKATMEAPKETKTFHDKSVHGRQMYGKMGLWKQDIDPDKSWVRSLIWFVE